MNNFKHFIITRFNIKMYDGTRQHYTTDKQQQKTHTDEWLNDRFEIFENLCFPSIAGQTNKNFIWICLFDIDTPDKYRKILETYKTKCSNFQPHFIEGAEHDKLYLPLDKIFNSYLESGDEYIITTNIDNDDAFHKDIVNKIQAIFLKSPEEMLYRFIWGYQYFENKKLLLKMKYPHNHFLTLVRKISSQPVKHITHYFHARAHRELAHKDIKDEPLWLEIVHSSNVNNDFRVNGKIKYKAAILTKNLKTDFNIDIVAHAGRNIANAFTSLPYLFLSTVGRKLKKKMTKKK